jgi:hypothetical protein
MKKARETEDNDLHVTTGALVIGFLGGLGIMLYGESLLGDIQGAGDSHVQNLANWQVDMGAACMGTEAFVIIFFLLELLGHKSKASAWRATWPWLPLVGLTALATVVHFPPYVVILMCILDAGWAYYKTRMATPAYNPGEKKRGCN